MVKRATKIERQRRVDTLLSLKARGYSYSQMVEAGKKLWGISDREVKRYLADVKKMEGIVGEQSPCEGLTDIALKLRVLYAQVMSDGNYELARKLLADSANIEAMKHKMQKQRGQVNEPASGPQVSGENEMAELLGLLEKQGFTPK